MKKDLYCCYNNIGDKLDNVSSSSSSSAAATVTVTDMDGDASPFFFFSLYALFLHKNILTPNFIIIFLSMKKDLYCCYNNIGDKLDNVSSSSSSSAAATVTVTDMDGDDVLVNDFVEQEETSIMDSQKDESSKWTNEKHSLYLKSIEASFVDQLYNSLDMQTKNTYSSDAISTWKNHPNTFIPSGQFKVLQRGCWSKKCFKRENSHPKVADRPQVSPSNPWIQHFTNASLKRLSSTSTSSQYPVTDSRLHQETGCSNTEVTDQNFVDDTTCSRKRTRTSKVTHSDNDQVVPLCNSDATAIPDSYVSSKKNTR